MPIDLHRIQDNLEIAAVLAVKSGVDAWPAIRSASQRERDGEDYEAALLEELEPLRQEAWAKAGGTVPPPADRIWEPIKEEINGA